MYLVQNILMFPAEVVLSMQQKNQLSCRKCLIAGVPGGLVRRCSACLLISVSWVRVSPSAYCYELARTFSCIKLIERKARERELLLIMATFDENQRAVEMLNPAMKMKTRAAERGRHL